MIIKGIILINQKKGRNKMTKKDYILLAKIMNDNRPEYKWEDIGEGMNPAYTTWESIRNDMLDELSYDNALFDRRRFIAACEGSV
jgi:hypothetical protein